MPTEIVETHPPAFAKRVWLVLSYIPLVLVVLTYGTHAVMGLTGSAELKGIVSVLRFGSPFTAVLVFFAGIHDGAVCLMVIFKEKLFPKLPWWPVFVYAAIWPVVPRLLIWMAGNPFEWVEVLIFGTMSLSAWGAQTARNRFDLRWN